MPYIRAPDGKVYDYAYYIEHVKPAWKAKMADERREEENES